MEEKLSTIENGSLSIKDIISDTKDFVSSVINNTDVKITLKKHYLIVIILALNVMKAIYINYILRS
jgi:hypothetical protein